jgi:hypothetical protein
MTAVRIRRYVVPVKITDHSDISPPTDVMAITSLPHTPANHPISGLPLSPLTPRVHLSPRPHVPSRASHAFTFALLHFFTYFSVICHPSSPLSPAAILSRIPEITLSLPRLDPRRYLRPQNVRTLHTPLPGIR